MPEAGNEPGGYFIPWARVSEQRPRFKNVDLHKRFKEWVDAELRAFEEASDGVGRKRKLTPGATLYHADYAMSLLKPLLKRSTQLNGEKARVVFTSSNVFEYAPDDGIEFDVLKDGPARDAKIKEYGFSSIPGKGAVWKIYGLSKFTANIFQRDHADEFSSYSVHPGGIQSELTRHSNSFEQLLSKAVMKPTPMGTLTQLYAGTMPEAGNVPGGVSTNGYV
ncbi:hypothetical protein M422DRAFT_263708 [Sphaerobolus stellatus SS14]|uniref:Uncharacterized protein n=1 Tax=Sphaerobolus stellatus (strain SS14) TaxID=990650 RepID=A0A0C9UY32_SPHS4|nr:hypothetical protein M422DRAFT_263708 [Sphaerobolus stellatus SS14]